MREWVVCHCGKERQMDIPDGLAESFAALAGSFLCASCSADLNRSHDLCPETVTTDGYSACRLSWGHTGRCEPQPAPDLSQWERDNARNLDSSDPNPSSAPGGTE